MKTTGVTVIVPVHLIRVTKVSNVALRILMVEVSAQDNIKVRKKVSVHSTIIAESRASKITTELKMTHRNSRGGITNRLNGQVIVVSANPGNKKYTGSTNLSISGFLVHYHVIIFTQQ